MARLDLQERRLRRLHMGEESHGRRGVLAEPLHDAVARHGLAELAPVERADDERGQCSSGSAPHLFFHIFL